MRMAKQSHSRPKIRNLEFRYDTSVLLAFEREERARRVVYWTLAAVFTLSLAGLLTRRFW
jgi:hypothetical protein